MAKNRLPEANPHESSSSEDDSGTDSDTEDEQQFTVKPSAARKPETPLKQSAAEPNFDSDDSGSGSDSDTPPRRPDRSLKSINSDPKPEEDPDKGTKKPRSKTTLVTPTPAKPAAAKRSVDADANGDRASKKAKKKDSDLAVVDATPKKEGEDSKKQKFQRLFSEDDEILLFEGLIEYKAMKGVDPISDITGFHEFIKKSLHVDVNKAQISEKVRRFKKKFENNIARAKNGKERKFSNPHEQKAFDLSKKIWTVEANGAGVDGAKVSDAKPKKNQSHKAKLDFIGSPIQSKEVTNMEVALDAAAAPVSFGGRKSVEELITEDGLQIVDGPKKSELQEKWKQLRAEEIKLYLKRSRLIQEQAEAVLQALEGPGH